MSTPKLPAIPVFTADLPSMFNAMRAMAQHLPVAPAVSSPSGATGATSAVPIGTIIAVAGTFSAVNNGGVYNEAGVSVGSGWKLCDGSLIADASSSFNGRYVPKLNDGRFLRGSTSPGVVGGQSSLNPSTAFAAAGNYTPAGTNAGNSTGTGTSGSTDPSPTVTGSHVLTTTEIPSHTHTHVNNQPFQVSNSAAYGYGGGATAIFNDGSFNTLNAAGGGGGHTHTIAAMAHTHSVPALTVAGQTFTGVAVARSDFFLNSAVNIEPVYLNVKFYQRIK